MNDIKYSVLVTGKEQLDKAVEYAIDKIYIPFDLMYWGLVDMEYIDRIHAKSNISVYLAGPRVVRKRDEMYLEALKNTLLMGKADGILVRNLELLGFLLEMEEELKKEYISINGKEPGYTTLYIDLDHNIYNWNRQALKFNRQFADCMCAPLELSFHELDELKNRDLCVVIYGRAPLMVSANCVKKTSGNCMADCTHGSFEWQLTDRMKKSFPVYCSCIHCYNEIFNPLITSYHKQMVNLINKGFYNFRLDFTTEDSTQMSKVLDYYLKFDRKNEFPLTDYTQGHILKGAI